MKLIKRLVLVGLLALCPALFLGAQSSITPDAVLATLRLVNDHFLNEWPDPGSMVGPPSHLRLSNNWTRATYFEGLMALYKIDHDARYYNYAVQWGTSHNWTLPLFVSEDGPYDEPDNQCCGQTYIELYQYDPQPIRIQDIKASLDNMLNRPVVNEWPWVDAMQMALPDFAKMGVMTGDTRYFDKMYALYWNTKTQQVGSGLYNTVDHLWYENVQLASYKEPNGANSYWSRGNGWVIGALVRVLDVLPTGDPHRAEYIQTFREMCAALKAVQRSDGFWNCSLFNPIDYAGPELSGTGFFVYGMAWGIRNGLLDKDEYLPVVARAWYGMANIAVHPDGVLGYVQGITTHSISSYDTIPPYDDYGTGIFLLGGSEMYLLATSEGRIPVPSSLPTPPATPQPPAEGLLTVVSARCNIGIGDHTVISGFALEGGKRTVLIRCVGPTLAQYKVTGPVLDPMLELINQTTGKTIVSNDDWGTGLYSDAAAITAMSAKVGAFALPDSSKDAAILITLDPGLYSVKISGKDGSTGLGLVEVY